MNFVATLGLHYRRLVEVLEDFPDDAWMVRRVSCWMAVRRKIRQIAEQRIRSKRKTNVMEKAMSRASNVEQEFVQLSDDARWTVKQMHRQFDDVQARLNEIEDGQTKMQEKMYNES